MFKKVLYEVKDNRALIMINRPDVRNAVDEETINELKEAFKLANDDKNVKAVIFTGSGDKVFAAGADLNDFLKLQAMDMLDYAQMGQDLILQIELMKKPVIAAINGHAAGMGCEMAMACTMRVITEKARIGLPELGLGIVPGNGGTQRLARLVGMGKAMEMILLGDLVDSATALQIGLVNRAVPADKLMETCEDLCKKLASKSPVAVRLAMKAVIEGMDMPLFMGLRHEVSMAALGIAGGDHVEGIKAFMEKRKPNF